MTETATLETRVRAAARRVRTLRALDGAVWGAAGALVSIAALGLGRALPPVSGALGAHAREFGSALWAVGLGVPALVACVAAFRTIATLPLLVALDRSHGLSDLLSSAWAFSRVPVDRRGRLSRITLARAERAAETLDVRRALPWRRPRGLFAVPPAALIAALAWFAWSPPPSAAAGAAPAVRASAPSPALAPAALAAFRQRFDGLDLPDSASGAGGELRAALEGLLDRLAREPVDRREVLRRLGALEAQARVLAAKTSAERAAAERAAAAWTTPSTAPSSDAPASAAGANPPPASSPPSAAPPPPRPPATAQRELPEPNPSPPSASAARPSAPSSDPRGDPSASPESSQAGESSAPPGAARAKPVAAAPSQPGNDTAPPGPELERERPKSGSDRDRAERLADAISELRDLMQRDDSVASDLGRPAPRSGADAPARDPERDGSRSNRPGAPDAAYARGGPQPDPRVGLETPEGNAPPLPAAAVRLPGTHSAGPARSQVIYAAAQSGFTGGDYARVHAEYQVHAERELERDRVPPGYRGYVRRYFQAIAPAAPASPHR